MKWDGMVVAVVVGVGVCEQQRACGVMEVMRFSNGNLAVL